MAWMRANSSGVRLCCWTNCGVMAGSVMASRDRTKIASAECGLLRSETSRLTLPGPACRTAAPMTKRAKYHRILLKLSGEALGGERGVGIDPEAVRDMARQIQEVRELGVQVVIVIGGGNIYRGLSGSVGGIERATGDYMGM